jgi:catechol-2,3-dioxygenase
MKKSALAEDLKLAPSELYVHDLKKTVEFYANVVGLDILDKTASYVVLGL